MDAFWEELLEEHGPQEDGQSSAVRAVSPAVPPGTTEKRSVHASSRQEAAPTPEPFDVTSLDAKERAMWSRFHAARAKGAPMLDPPRLEDTRCLVREDTPWYITAAFIKIFQTGAGDYWAYAKARQHRGMPVSLQAWIQHVLRGRDGRALCHPRFFYFAVNTLLRNRAVRGKSYFVKKAYGEQAHQEYTPQQLLRMGKAGMARVLCAYETNLPGSAAEKLAQRADLESMLNQLEEESAQKAVAQMPHCRAALQNSMQAMREWSQQWHAGKEHLPDSVVQGALRGRTRAGAVAP